MSKESQSIQDWLSQNDVDSEHIKFQQSVHTVDEAVKISGHPVECFTKSIVMLDSNNKLIIAMVPASFRASTERVRKALDLIERPRTVTADESEQMLGQKVGGNSPLNASQATILIDPKVFERDWILTGGGDDRSLVKISTEELKRVINFQEARVRK